MPSKVYLIPSLLHEDAVHTIPAYIIDAVKECQVFFVENERTARRFLKKIWKEMVIDDYEWWVSDNSQLSDTSKMSDPQNVSDIFRQKMQQNSSFLFIKYCINFNFISSFR